MRRPLVFVLLLLLTLAGCQPDEVPYRAGDEVFSTGDDQHWAATTYDDSGWRQARGATGAQLFWLRNHLVLGPRDPAVPLGLQVRAFGGFEVYWDGTLIGRNGRPATALLAEIPGTETSYYLVPEALAAPGTHVVALRATQVHLGQVQRFVQFRLGSYPRLLRDPLLLLAFVNLLAGALLLAALYYLFLFFNRRRGYGMLLFSGCCLLCFALLMVEYARYYLAIPYPYFYVRLEVIGGLTLAIALLVPYFFALQFGLPRKALLASVWLTVLVGIYGCYYPHYDLTALRLSQALWLATLLLAGWAWRRQAQASALVLGGLLAGAISYYYLITDVSLFITLTLLVLCMLFAQAHQVKALERDHQTALLRSSRLQLELLRKQLQPHFIRNTLTSLLDWVEESPAQGAAFVQALAREWELLYAMAEATLVPICQELELCRYHLQVMQFRQEAPYTLCVTGIDPAEWVPPAIFHTLLENGITHSQLPLAGGLHFTLHYERVGIYKTYQLLVCAPPRLPAQPDKASRGTGLRYIAARLQESYGTGWELRSHAVPQGWLTTISIQTP